MILATNGIIQSKAAAASGGIITTGLQFYVDTENPASYTGTVGTWYDLSGNGNNAIGTNTPTYNATEKAMYLSGGGAFFNIPVRTGFPVGAAPRSMGGWYKFGAGGNPDFTGILYYGSYQNAGNNFELMFNNGSKLGFGGWFLDYNTTFPLTAGQWYNLCATYDGTTLKIYLNAGTTPFSVATTLNTSLSGDMSKVGAAIGLHVTRNMPAHMYTRMSYVYDFALTQAQVTENYNNTLGRF